ncbi:ubiquitin interaction domain-containing protein [Pseudomassariella vexata]|uniref:Ubiquitin interaction domain-containing protein n=1 Tax=Pseudomassariella vexata TaxID=1141098 RepID=A0A1Y2E6H5_9PEZI|nr:ubiquitin interaction domain-containing protein [Pseudomassariella vexata]ORY67160.1 ubiquitin interaction domain-containing protein [Pseudomassariella vexata]
MEGSDPFDGDEDAALRYAIALSLQDAEQDKPIELSSDDDSDDLDKAPITTPAMGGLAALDRKKMEEERLARQGKRKAPDSEQDTQGDRQRLKTGPLPTIERLGMTSKANPTLANPNSQGLPFPRGVVKKTWAYGYPRTGDDIKIEEVLQKNELELAVISSFQWDEEWMLSKIDIKKTKIVCIAFASSKQQQDEMTENVPKGSAIRFCFPPMLPYGNMHSKLQILKYPKYLRLVVPSGNLVSYDWGETGVMENIVFIIDLPRIEDPKAREENQLTMFGDDLLYFLEAQGLQEGLVNSLKNYDFSETSRYSFVHSIGKTHTGDSWKRTGYCGLGRAVTALGLGTQEDVEIDLVTSSLGSVNKDLVAAIYYAAKGDDGMKEYGERTTKTGKGKAEKPSASTIWAGYRDRLRLYFPSQDTVAKSRGGTQSAGTICAQSKWWDAATFPRELVHDCKSVRDGLLMHNKIMLVRLRQAGKGPPAWGYVGSANLSESAWGRLTRDRQTGKPKLTCRNWECGVIIPTADGGQTATGKGDSSVGMSVFLGSIPIPMVVPGETYGQTGSKRPWLFLEN